MIIKNAHIIMIVALIVLTACSATPTNQIQEEQVKIGFAAPLSGEFSTWGQAIQKGFEFGLEELREQGTDNLKVVYEDTDCDAAKGIQAYQKLTSIDNVKIITGTICSRVALSAHPQIKDKDILFLSSGASHPDVPKLGENVFSLWVADDYEARILGRYSREELKAKTATIIYLVDHPTGNLIKEEFTKTFTSNGGEILDAIQITGKQKDLTTTVTKAIAKNPDTIYLVADPSNAALLIQKIREQDYHKPLLIYGPSITSEIFETQVENKKNLYYAYSKEMQQTDFWKSYKEKTGEEPDPIIALGYDSIMLINEATSKCESDTDCIISYLKNLDIIQTTRGNFTFDEYGALANVSFEVFKVQ